MATVSSAPRTTAFTTVSTTAGPFNIPWRLFDTDSLDVYLNGVRTTAFTVSATFANGFTDSATLTLNTAAASGTQIIIDGALTPRRDANYLPSDPALTTKINIELARLWSGLAEVKRDSERAVRAFSATDPLEPEPGRVVMFDDQGQATNGPTVSEVASANANGIVNAGFWIASVAALASDTGYAYTASPGKVVVAPGTIIQTRMESFSYTVAASGATDHDLTTAGGVKLYGKGPSDLRRNANARQGINFFDFIWPSRTSTEREQIANRTFTGDLATEWTAFRNALAAEAAAGRRPHGIIPDCLIRTSVSPNFAMDFLRLQTTGLPSILNIGGGPGIVFNGRDLGPFAVGVRRLDIDPIEASSETGSAGWQIIYCHESYFKRPQTRGAVTYGIEMRACMMAFLETPSVSNYAAAWITRPSVGIFLGGRDRTSTPTPLPVCWSTIMNPTVEYTHDIGIEIDNALGTAIFNGTSEGIGYQGSTGTGHGMVMRAMARRNKIFGGTYEFNTGDDIRVDGSTDNTFTHVDVSEIWRFTGAAYRNSVFGGTTTDMFFESLTAGNLVNGMTILSTVTDTSTATGKQRNRIFNNQGGGLDNNWNETQVVTTPTVTAQTGTLTSATATVVHSITATGQVTFTATVNITTNGTGGGWLNLNLPYAAGFRTVFPGRNDTTAVAVLGDVTAASNVLRIRRTDAGYPGADGTQLTVSGTYERP